MATNIIDAGLGTSPVKPFVPKPILSKNLIDAGLGQTAPVGVETKPVSLQRPANLIDAGLGQTTPPPGTRLAPTFEESWTDPGKGFFGHAWNVANTPVWDQEQVSNFMGTNLGYEPGGVTRGFAGLVAGFTTPLSLALILGGPVGKAIPWLRTGGEALLMKLTAEGGAAMTGAEASAVTKAAPLFYKARRAGKTAAESLLAVKEAGHDPDLLVKGLETLTKAGMTPESLLSHGIIRRTASSSLRSWLGPAKAEKIGARVQGAVDAYFSAHMAYGAVTTSAMALDALREGNVEKFKEYAIQGAGGGALAIVAGMGAAREAGSLVSDAKAWAGLQVKPTEENLALQNQFGIYDKDALTIGRANELWAGDIRKWGAEFQKQYPGINAAEITKLTKDPQELQRIINYVEAGGDKSVMAERFKYVTQASGLKDVLGKVPEAETFAARREAEIPAVNQIPTAPQVPELRADAIIGGSVSKPASTYREAIEVEGNPWIRRSADPVRSVAPTNEGRTLLVQVSSDLIHEYAKDEASTYYDKLYSGARPGYAKLQDFWEIPQWIGFASKNFPDADVYVVRTEAEAIRFLNEAKYDRVMFSAMDTNKDLIRNIVKGYEGKVDIGGYTDSKTFADLPNAKWHDSLESVAKDAGISYQDGVDYRHFEGSDTIPRLTLSDGCLHTCAFCVLADSKLKLSPKEKIDQQVDEISKLGSKLVYINDKTFGQAKNYEYLAELSERLKKQNPGFRGFVVQTTAAQLGKIPEEWLAKSGIKYVELGIESYNDPLLKEMKKPATEALIDKAVDKLRKNKVALIPNILIGYPGETAETYAHTMEFLRRNQDIISHANIYNLAVYENTDLGKKFTTASPSDFNENVLEKSFHTEPEIHARFAGDLYGLASKMLEKKPELLEGEDFFAARRRLPTYDTVKKENGTTENIREGAFIGPEGDIIPFGGTYTEHPQMLGVTRQEGLESKLEFIKNTGAIRMRFRVGKAGNEYVFSIPAFGITHDQVLKIQAAAKDIPDGRIVIETTNGRSVQIDFPKSAEIENVIENLATPTEWAARRRKLPAELLETERTQLERGRGRTEKFFEIVKDLPPVKELVAAAKTGAVGRFWYDRSIAAFDAMRQEAPEYFRPEDADVFAGITAAMSPTQPVRMDLIETLKFWKEWVDAGRPNTKQEIQAAQRAGRISRLGNQPAKIDHVVRAIRGEEMLPAERERYFKVGNFAKNLLGVGNHVTADSWMGVFAGLSKKDLERSPFYHAFAYQTRLAAQELGWEPAQAQAAIWTFTKTLAELSGWNAETFVKPVEMLSELTPEKMATASKDFADLMFKDRDIRYQLTRLGVDLNELDRRLTTIKGKPLAEQPEGVDPESIKRAAERIGATQRQLEGFTGYVAPEARGEAFEFPGPADTTFEPETLEARAPGFYSKAERVAEQKLSAAASGEQILATLRNSGVKEDEIKWTGLDDFLAGKPKVSKQEVQDFLRENQVQVDEKVLGGTSWKVSQGEAEPTKFNIPNLVIPGGENYRELLLTLPNLSDEAFIKAYKAKTGVDVSDVPPDQLARLRRAGAVREATGEFVSGHFDEPNVLAHVRMNDRVDASGKRTLFLEEVQSDWHQRGRREGYAGGLTPAEESKIAVLQTERDKILAGTLLSQLSPTSIKALQVRNIEAELYDLNRKRVSGIPDAPFKSTWHELAMKRMLRYAAENGYDQVAWTTGEMQAVRYDLSKQVDKISIFRDDTGIFEITARPRGQKSEIGIATNISKNELSRHIGKDLAAKVEDTPGRQDFTGLDLKVGGEGMKGFYDKILPDFMNRYGKKWGAKGGETQLEQRGPYRSQAEAIAAEKTPGPKVHSIDVTSAMKKSVMEEGQPLFARKEPVRKPDMQRDPEGFANQVAANVQVKYEPRKGLTPGFVSVDENAKAVLETITETKDWSAITIRPVGVPRVMTALQLIEHNVREHNPAAAAKIAELRKAFSIGLQEHPEGGVAVVPFEAPKVREPASLAAEERFHIGQIELGRGRIEGHADLDKLSQEPEMEVFKDSLALLGYNTDHVQTLVVEAAAHIGVGDELGIGGTVEQRASFFTKYLYSVAKVHGSESLGRFEEIVTTEMRTILQNMREMVQKQEEVNAQLERLDREGFRSLREQRAPVGEGVQEREIAARTREGGLGRTQKNRKRTLETRVKQIFGSSQDPNDVLPDGSFLLSDGSFTTGKGIITHADVAKEVTRTISGYPDDIVMEFLNDTGAARVGRNPKTNKAYIQIVRRPNPTQIQQLAQLAKISSGVDYDIFGRSGEGIVADGVNKTFGEFQRDLDKVWPEAETEFAARTREGGPGRIEEDRIRIEGLTRIRNSEPAEPQQLKVGLRVIYNGKRGASASMGLIPGSELTIKTVREFEGKPFWVEASTDAGTLTRYYVKDGQLSIPKDREPTELAARRGQDETSHISPEDFLRRAEVDENNLSESDRTRIAYYRTQIADGKKIEPVEMTIDQKGDLIGHDGVLRAIAMRESGVKSIPVQTHHLGTPSEEIEYLARRTTPPSLTVGKVGEAMDDARIQELTEARHLEKSTEYTPEERSQLADSYDPGKLTPTHEALAKEIQKHFTENFEQAFKSGALKEAAENYMTHIWGKNVDNEAVRSFMHNVNAGTFAINTPMARHRMFQTAFEGQLLGKKLAVRDPITLAAHNGNAFGRVAAARATLDRLRSTNVRASDGRPMVVLAGTGKVVQGENGENPAILVNPKTIRSIRIAGKIIQGLERTGDLDRLIKDGKIEKLKDRKGQDIYAWNPSDYRTIDHPAMHDWNYMTAAPDGTPVMMKADLKVHPEAYKYLKQQLGRDRSQMAETGLGKALLATTREAKGILLFGDVFHLSQEGLRAVMTGISPFGVERWDLRNDPMLSKGVSKGLTLGKDFRGIQDYDEGVASGHSKIIKKIPILGWLNSELQHFMFDKYIPGLKARAYKHLFNRYKESYPDWTADKVAEIAAADTNERFGGLNYRRMGRSVATQDLFKLTTLAPDWLESEIRFFARAFGDEGKIAQQDTARMVLLLWGATRVLNYLTSGQSHNEAPFGVVVKDKDGKDKVWSVRTLPTDVLHAVQDPGGFLAGRVAPMARSTIQVYTGRDEYGRKIPEHNIAFNMARNAAPIHVQSKIKEYLGEKPETTTGEQVMKSAGLQPYEYRTEAQKKAAELASDHSEKGPVEYMELRKHQAKMKFEDDLRTGQMTNPELFRMVQLGQLSPDDAKTILKNVQNTRGMDANLARLWLRASRLPAPEFLEVWDKATNDEKATLSKLLIKKRIAYYKKIMTDFTPEERMKDSTYLRLQRMFPQAQPF